MEAARTGVLLINLGTPDQPTPGSVRRYLREFLSDPRVVDLSPVGRWLLLNVFILPFRPARSAAAYGKIWTPGGSPLLKEGRALEAALGQVLGPSYAVRLGMRYGNPSLRTAIQALEDAGVRELILLPLYPQYASSSTGSSLEAAYRILGRAWNTLPLRTLPAFYDHPGFVNAFVERGREAISRLQPDHVLFSFHGLPERQIRKSDRSGRHCLQSQTCCDPIAPANAFCYRAQCYATARAIAAGLALEPQRFSVSFQSRLGRRPWIRPYTDHLLPELVGRGVRRLSVFCPSFVADCLETLEEIGLRGREQFLAAGGEELVLVPSLNAQPSWVRALAGWVTAAAFSQV